MQPNHVQCDCQKNWGVGSVSWYVGNYQQFYIYSSETSSGVDQDQVLEELLGKVKSTPNFSTKSNVHPFKTPQSAFNSNLASNGLLQCKTSPIQNPFRKNTGMRRPAAKQVQYLVLFHL